MATASKEANGEFTHPAVRRVELIGKLFDDSIPLPGTNYRFGLDPILGIVPLVGDAIAAAFSLYILVEAARLDVDTSTLVRMATYVGVDAVIGSVPVVGTLFDAAWKANTWNARLLAANVDVGDSPTP